MAQIKIHLWQVEADDNCTPIFVHAMGCPNFCEYACGGVEIPAGVTLDAVLDKIIVGHARL